MLHYWYWRVAFGSHIDWIFLRFWKAPSNYSGFFIMNFSHLIILNYRVLLQTFFGLPGEMNVCEHAPKSLASFPKIMQGCTHSQHECWTTTPNLILNKKLYRNKSLIKRDLTLRVSLGTWLHMSLAHSMRNMKANYSGRRMRRHSRKTQIWYCSKQQLDITGYILCINTEQNKGGKLIHQGLKVITAVTDPLV